MKRKPKTTSEWIAIIVVPVVSLLNIGYSHFFTWDYSFLISFIGLLFPVSFFLNMKIYEMLLFVFAFSQLIIIHFIIGDRLFNLSQVINLGLGLKLSNSLYIGAGIPGIFLLALAIRVRMDSIFGMRLHLLPLKHDPNLANILPADVEIVKRMKVGDETSWYLVRFLHGENEACALIRAKDSYVVKTGINQVVEFWWVEDPQWFLSSDTVVKKLLRKPALAVVR